MSEPLDAYYKWLAIPPAEQPPNHYRLLGLPFLEADQEVIAAAAVQRINWVRKFQKGPHASLANQLALEIKDSWKCLINAEAKQKYDAELKRANAPTAQPIVAEKMPLPPTPTPRLNSANSDLFPDFESPTFNAGRRSKSPQFAHDFLPHSVQAPIPPPATSIPGNSEPEHLPLEIGSLDAPSPSPAPGILL